MWPKHRPIPAIARLPWRTAAIALVLAAMTLAVFAQTLGFGFVNFDDGFYVYHNAIVKGGLSVQGLAWVFSHADCRLYHPLTMLSLMADDQIHGLDAGGYHLTNLLLHLGSVILLFVALLQMTGAPWRSAFVAAVFAVHPLRVESVAWIAERKDVLGTFFSILTIAAYAQYVRRPDSLARYLAVLAAFAAALLSKPTAVTLPFVLLLLDWWPLQRAGQVKRLLLEKIPLLALSAAACALTILAAKKEVASYAHVPAASRLANALVSYAIYLRQMIWPRDLAVFYPRPENGWPPAAVAISFLVLTIITAAAVALRAKRRWLLAGWLWYLGMLTPMIGLVQAGAFAHADRFTYLPQIGIYIALTWLAAECLAKFQLSRALAGILMTAILGTLLVCSWRQTAYWRNSETLWTHALACTTRNYMAHYNLGEDLIEKGKLDAAAAQFETTLQIKPDNAEAWNNLGSIYFNEGRTDPAIAQFQKAVQLEPDYADAHFNLATALMQKGRIGEAAGQFQEASRLKPADAKLQYNLADALQREGKLDEARIHYREALRLRPDFAAELYNLGNEFGQKGNLIEAITQYKGALQLDPNHTAARINLARALLQTGNADEAIVHLQQALQLDPSNAAAHNALGNALLQKGNVAEAIPHFQKAIELDPGDPSPKNSLAWLLATSPVDALRNGAKAAELAQQANDQTGGEDPLFLRTLAAAQAESGKFPEAAATCRHALTLADSSFKTALATQLQAELKLYESSHPFHTSHPIPSVP